MAANWSGPPIKVERHYESDLPQVALDENFAEQVFINLAQNAYEAMGETGGRLRISIGAVQRGERRGIEVRVPIPGRAFLLSFASKFSIPL